MVPPVAGLVYAVEEPRQATFYPLARFSPEWVAARWALAHGVPVRFLDLPATHAFALAEEAAGPPSRPRTATRTDEPSSEPPAPAGAPRPDRHAGGDRRLRRRRALVGGRRRAAARLARRAVRRDPGGDGLGPRGRRAPRRRPRRARQRAPRGLDAPGAAGGDQGGPRRRGSRSCAAPGTRRRWSPPTSRRRAATPPLLTRLPRTKVAAAWTPWTAARLSYASGYGAGVGAPGWYQHLFDHLTAARPGPPRPRDDAGWCGSPAPCARRSSTPPPRRWSRPPASPRPWPPSAVGPSVGLSELDDAAAGRAVRGLAAAARPGPPSASSWARSSASVPESSPVVPLAADLARQQRSLRLKPTACRPAGRPRPAPREPARPARSCSTGCALLGVGWGEPPTPAAPPAPSRRAGRSSGGPSWPSTSSRPSVWGTTIAAAAAARAADRAAGVDRPHRARRAGQRLPHRRPPRRHRRGARRPRRAGRGPARRTRPALDGRAARPHLPLRRRARRRHRPRPHRAGRHRRPRVRRACRWRARASTRRRPTRWSAAIAGAHRGCRCSPTQDLDARVGGGAGVGVGARPRRRRRWRAGPPGSCSTPAASTSDDAAHRMGRRLSLAASAPQAAAWLDGLPGRRRRPAGARPRPAGAGRRVGRRARRDDLRGPAAAGAPYVLRVQPSPSAAPSASSVSRLGRHRRRAAARGVAVSTSTRPTPALHAVARLARLEGGGA